MVEGKVNVVILRLKYKKCFEWMRKILESSYKYYFIEFENFFFCI